MWKLWNLIFGWDYVCIENIAAAYVRRVWTRGDGVHMVSAYSFEHWELKPPYHGWQVTPLTKGAKEKIEVDQ